VIDRKISASGKVSQNGWKTGLSPALWHAAWNGHTFPPAKEYVSIALS